MVFSRIKLRIANLRRLERHAGFAVAIPLCSLGMLLMLYIRIPERIEPIPMKIMVEAEPEPDVDPVPTPEPPPAPETDALPPEVAATRVNSDETGEELNDPMPGAEEGSAEVLDVDPTPPSFSDWLPNTSEAAELAAISRELAAQTRAIQEKQQQLKESIVRQRVSSAAKDFIANSDGGLAGAVRVLNLEGYPTEKVIPVMERYGFTYERRHITPSAGRSFLNAAVTDTGVYTNESAEGLYDVLVHSAKSISMMATREVDALNRAGYDPRRTRVMRVVFGIVVRPDGELDLDVIELKAERIP